MKSNGFVGSVSDRANHELKRDGQPAISEGPEYRFIDLLRNRIADRYQRSRLFGNDARHYCLRCWSGERRLSGQHLEQDRTKCVDVSAMIHGPVAHCLLGRHVLRGSERHPGLRQSCAGGLLDSEGDPEISDERMAVENRMFSGLMSRCTTPRL